MAKNKQTGKKLPVNPKILLEAVGFAEGQSVKEGRISVLVDVLLEPALLAYAKEALRSSVETVQIAVIPYSDEPPAFAHNSDLAIVLGAGSSATGRIMTQALKERIPAVVATLDPFPLQTIARENYHEIDALSIVTASPRATEEERFERLFASLGAWIVRELPDDRVSLARALAFVRDPFVENAIQATSVQNAAIAAVFFLPGADLPLLTVNQIKLFSQIAAVYGADLDKGRILEIAILLLSGFGFRAVARKLIGVVPVLGWAVRGSVGYTGTLVIGKAAHEYFKQGGSLSSLPLPGLAGRSDPEVDAQ
jgi:uncharacterized protein (DUF697 family)